MDFAGWRWEWLLAAVLAHVVGWWLWSWGQEPPEHKPVTSRRKPTQDCTRDSFSASKVPPDVDFVVVGSGMGGLSTAAMLSKFGHRVVVLEQHYIAGGCLHEFEVDNMSSATGLHYLTHPGFFSAWYDWLAAKPLEFHQMGVADNDGIYDTIIVADKPPFNFRANRLFDDLKEAFPDDAAGIDKLVALSKRSSKGIAELATWSLLPSFVRRWQWLRRWWLRNHIEGSSRLAYEVLEELFPDNAHLRALIMATYGDAGGPPHKVVFSLLSLVLYAYSKGGYYPKGDTLEIVRGLVPTIEATGGRVLVRAPVAGLVLTKTGRVRGVRVAKAGGDVIVRARRGVISACGTHNTVHRFLPPSVAEPYKPIIERCGPSIGHVYVFVGFKPSASGLELPEQNMWVLPCPGEFKEKTDLIGAMRRHYARSPEALIEAMRSGEMLVFIAFPSVKDPTYPDRHVGRHTAIVLTEVETQPFTERWGDTEYKHRPQDYTELKEQIGDALLEHGLFAMFPHLREHVETVEVGTPLSSKHFLGSAVGESLGLRCSPYKMSSKDLDFQFEELLPGLHMTGQDLYLPGVSSALIAGVLTSMKVNGVMRTLLTPSIWGALATAAKHV